MVIYVFKCTLCKATVQKKTSSTPKMCNSCKQRGVMEKQFSAPNL